MTEIIITPLVVPSHAQDPDGAEFRRMIDLGNQLARIDAGIDDLDETAEQLLPFWHDQTDRIRAGFIARRGTEIVGAADLSVQRAAGTTAAEIGLMALPDQLRRGVGQALLAHAERDALALGCTVLQTWSMHPASPTGRTLIPTTGWGRVGATSLSDVLEAAGYVLEQVERNSVLALDGPRDLAERRLREAEAFAGPDYRVVTWTLPTPPHLRAGYGAMISRMATDVPSGDLETQVEVWDEERVARRDARIIAGGQTLSVAAVIHTPTGSTAAFNELVIGSDHEGVTHQWGTLVVGEHRGKRLGTIVKCANLLRWHEIAPRSPRISTFNAEENRPMLDINEAIGFVPASYAGGWQKRLR